MALARHALGRCSWDHAGGAGVRRGSCAGGNGSPFPPPPFPPPHGHPIARRMSTGAGNEAPSTRTPAEGEEAVKVKRTRRQGLAHSFPFQLSLSIVEVLYQAVMMSGFRNETASS